MEKGFLSVSFIFGIKQRIEYAQMHLTFAFNVLVILTCSYFFHENQMEDLPEQEKNTDVVDELEIQYYEVQLELYEVKFEILKYEEILLITQLDSIKRLIRGKIYT